MKFFELNSPNKQTGRNGHVPDMVVFGFAEMPLNEINKKFTDPSTHFSAHYIIAEDGTVYRYVNITDRAMCVSTSVVSDSENCYKNGKGLISYRAFDASLYTISVLFEGKKLTDAQRETAPALLSVLGRKLLRVYGRRLPCDENHIVTFASLPNFTGSADIPVNEFVSVWRSRPFI